jgi:hypothetical protein
LENWAKEAKGKENKCFRKEREKGKRKREKRKESI